MSVDEVDKLNWKNNEVDMYKSMRKQRRKGAQKSELVDTPCGSNIY